VAKETRKYKDRAEYLKAAVARRRRKLKNLAIKYKGGRCIFCGYSKYNGALEFHHLDTNKKDFGLSVRGLTRSWERIKKELDKCILVCSNCHKEIHGGLLQPSRETLRSESWTMFAGLGEKGGELREA
jgi:predicted HNH restriction endonuclease